MADTPSPCKDICTLDASKQWCLGCGRSLDEIAGWQKTSEAQRQAIVAQLPARMARFAGQVTPPETLSPEPVEGRFRFRLPF